MARRRQRATLHDIVELLTGIGTILMMISAQLDDIIYLLGGEQGEKADA